MDVADLTLDELRLALAPGIADAAVFDGWSDAALEMAADQLGADRDVARLAFKDEGAMGMICAWIETSRAETGSSQINIEGSDTRARAIEMRWHCPPENWNGRRSKAVSGSRPTAVKTSRTRAARSSGVPIFMTTIGISTMSDTLRLGFREEMGS